jgi:C_GCAxxG_C_C family probable redox protein
MKRVEKATELRNCGYNCAQAVFASFADLYGMDEVTALKLSTSMGGGIGGTRNVCGAVSAMAMVAGLETGISDAEDKDGKKRNYDIVKSLLDEFEKENGSVVCKELLGLVETPVPLKKKPCMEYIRFCAQLVEEKLLKDKDI